jgi:hypothetical protein
MPPGAVRHYVQVFFQLWRISAVNRLARGAARIRTSGTEFAENRFPHFRAGAVSGRIAEEEFPQRRGG